MAHSIPQRKTPQERMLGMVSWYISRYHRQTVRSGRSCLCGGAHTTAAGLMRWVEACLGSLQTMGAAGGSGRKPYNPILAEQFHCKWTGDFGELTLLSEQGKSRDPTERAHGATTT